MAVVPAESRLTRRWVGVLWALLPLLLSLPAAPCFAFAAWKLRSRALATEAAGYLAVTALWVTLADQHDSTVAAAGAWLAFIAAGVSCTRAFVVRGRVFPAAGRSEQPSQPTSTATPATSEPWSPVFPATTMPRPDPNNPATWVVAAACNGNDRHSLSVPLPMTVMYAAAGAAMAAFSAYLHVYGRGFSAGIGLMLLPVFAVLFSRWVDGPVLYYRSWGRLHSVRLDTVTAVTTGKPTARTSSVRLAAPGLAKPVPVSLRAGAYTAPAAARDHLRGWLSHPGVQWSPAARALLDGHPATGPTTPKRRRWRQALALTVTVLLPLTSVGVGAWLIHRRRAALAITGAPGYRTFTGPRGKPLAVGRPWGRPCQPIRFSVEEHVPDWAYAQVAAVVAEARRDGVNVTLETRDFSWTPGSLYYPPGQTPANVPRVGIFAHSETPPKLAGGGPEHIGFGWDAALDPDGHHEDLTGAKGDLWMQVLDGHRETTRRSIRQLIAMTQGIMRTSRRDSGIARTSTIDRFTPSDVAAMRVMSGCGSVAATVP